MDGSEWFGKTDCHFSPGVWQFRRRLVFEHPALQSLTSRCYWLELLDAADTKYIATLIVGGKFVQIISDVSQTVDHPYDPLNFLAHFLRPPGLRPNAAS